MAIQNPLIATAGDGRQQDELALVLGQANLATGLRSGTGNPGTAVGQTGCDAEQDGRVVLFGELVAVADHVIGFLLVPRLQGGNE